MIDTGDERQVERLRDLGTMELVPVGTRVRVHEDGIVYCCGGAAAEDVARRIGWPASTNVWLPDHALQWIRLRHTPIVDPVLVAALIISRPSNIHQGSRSTAHRHFIIDADLVRHEQLLTSRSVRYVDSIVELRQVSGGSILRLFHLAPCDVNRGGISLWP